MFYCYFVLLYKYLRGNIVQAKYLSSIELIGTQRFENIFFFFLNVCCHGRKPFSDVFKTLKIAPTIFQKYYFAIM